MSARGHNEFVTAWIEENRDTVARAASRAASASWGMSRADRQHEIEMALVMHLYANPERVAEVVEQGWLAQFVVVWIQRNAPRVMRRALGRDVPYGDFFDAPECARAADESRVDDLARTYVDAERGPEAAREYVRDLVGQGMSDRQVSRVLACSLASYDALDGAERALFRMYFREGRSVRKIAEATQLPRSTVHEMIQRMKNKIREYVVRLGV